MHDTLGEKKKRLDFSEQNPCKERINRSNGMQIDVMYSLFLMNVL